MLTDRDNGYIDLTTEYRSGSSNVKAAVSELMNIYKDIYLLEKQGAILEL